MLALLAIVIIILLTLPALLPALDIGLGPVAGVWLCILGLAGLVGSFIALRVLAPWIGRKLGPRFPVRSIPVSTIAAGLAYSSAVHTLTIISAMCLGWAFGLDVPAALGF